MNLVMKRYNYFHFQYWCSSMQPAYYWLPVKPCQSSLMAMHLHLGGFLIQPFLGWKRQGCLNDLFVSVKSRLITADDWNSKEDNSAYLFNHHDTNLNFYRKSHEFFFFPSSNPIKISRIFFYPSTNQVRLCSVSDPTLGQPGGISVFNFHKRHCLPICKLQLLSVLKLI